MQEAKSILSDAIGWVKGSSVYHAIVTDIFD